MSGGVVVLISAGARDRGIGASWFGADQGPPPGAKGP